MSFEMAENEHQSRNEEVWKEKEKEDMKIINI